MIDPADVPGFLLGSEFRNDDYFAAPWQGSVRKDADASFHHGLNIFYLPTAYRFQLFATRAATRVPCEKVSSA